MERRVSTIDYGHTDLAEQIRLLGVYQHKWLNIPVAAADSEPTQYSMAFAEALGQRLHTVLTRSWNTTEDPVQPQPPVTEAVKTAQEITTAAQLLPKEEERSEEVMIKEDELEEKLEEEVEEEEEMMAYEADEKLHEQLMRKNYSKYSKKSCPSSKNKRFPRN